MFRAWGWISSRATRDIDLLARMDNSVEAVMAVFRDVCALEVEPDGLVFDPSTVSGAVIKEEAVYPGVRVTFTATLHTARAPMQADIGFADVVTPGPVPLVYPVILEFPAPKLSGYTPETVVAEKFEAMVRLGEMNSRMKDFYDLWVLSRRFDFDGAMLAQAIARTFQNRTTEMPTLPIALTPAFVAVPGKDAQWKGFVRKAKLTDAPISMSDVLGEIAPFLIPITQALNAGSSFLSKWQAPGPWK